MGKAIAITNKKGDCEKSFMTASLGVELICQCKKVLCIDTDNQTVNLGVTEPDRLETTLAAVISEIIGKKDFDPTAEIIRHPEGIDLMPANNDIADSEFALEPQIGRGAVLKRLLLQSIAQIQEFINRTSAIGKSIFTHDPNGRVAAAYDALAKEVFEIA
jgi:chromosome partitioning protein